MLSNPFKNASLEQTIQYTAQTAGKKCVIGTSVYRVYEGEKESRRDIIPVHTPYHHTLTHAHLFFLFWEIEI